jgi:hypothetical protein
VVEGLDISNASASLPIILFGAMHCLRPEPESTMTGVKTFWLGTAIIVIGLSAIILVSEIKHATAGRSRLVELSRVLARDYNLSLPTNAVLLHYEQRHTRIRNSYYQIELPDNDWQSMREDIVQKTGGILHKSELTPRVGVDLPWWTAAPGATIYFEKRDRSSPQGTVMIYLVSEKPKYYVFIERAD